MNTTQDDLKVIFEFLKNHILSNGSKVVSPVKLPVNYIGEYETTTYIFKNMVFCPQAYVIYANIHPLSNTDYFHFRLRLKDDGQYVCRNEENLIRCVSDLIKERLKKWND